MNGPGEKEATVPGVPAVGISVPGLDADATLALDVELASASWLLAVFLFGSRALGRPRSDSDLDLGLLLDPLSPLVPRSPLERAEWIVEWAAKLSSRLGLAVDAVDLERAGVVLVHQVLSTGRKLVERDAVRTRGYEARALMAYYDFLPVERELARAAMASIRNRARW